MHRYSWLVVGALNVVACGDTQSSSQRGSTEVPQSPGLLRFGQHSSARPIQPAFVPKAVDPSPVKVMVRLDGDPITRVQAKAKNRRLTFVERDKLRSSIKERQADVRRDLEAMGAKVIRQYQNAYNGFALRVPRNELARVGSVPGVTGVYPVRIMRPALTRAVPFVGGPTAWTFRSTGFHGEGIKVAIIDSGIDYTHANFGGPGTEAAYTAAHAAEAAPPDPALIGPGAPRIKGGIDLVGDAYDPEADDPALQVPKPDPNPLDCQGHGSHVAGIVGGSGVTPEGGTYAGPYDATTYTKAFGIGPGVAPRADLYAVRVFGCDGSTDVTIDAIEWAVDNDMNVINMSLGSALGGPEDPTAQAASNAVEAGVVVIASAGNDGSNPYVTGSPASANLALSVAAMDVMPTIPGASLTLPDGSILSVQNSNGGVFADGASYPVVVLGTPEDIGLGCDAADYARPDVAGALVITRRGTCDRVARAILGEAAGAAAVAMVNTEVGYPPYEGEIDGASIPFFGVLQSAAAGLAAASSVDASNIALENPGYRVPASFTSGGPRFSDSALKPNVIAPGVSVVSTRSGSGNGGLTASGTSMAAPVVTGLAALVRQAHPTWAALDVEIAISNTADPTLVSGYSTRLAGTGVPQAIPAITTRATVMSDFMPAVNLGFIQLGRDRVVRAEIEVFNDDRFPMTFEVSVPPAFVQGFAHELSVPSSVRVPAKGSAKLSVGVDLSLATPVDPLSFNDIAGIVQLTPTDARTNRGVVLRIPYYAVVRPVARLSAAVIVPEPGDPTGSARISSRGSAIPGTADFYALGIEDEENEEIGCNDVRAVGVQSFPDGTDSQLVFAINGWRRCSNASIAEYDILLTNETGENYAVIGVDQGLVEAGFINGQFATLILNLTTGDALLGPAFAPTDSSNVYLSARASELGLTPDAPRFSYGIESYSVAEEGDDFPDETALFNAFGSALIGQGEYLSLEPGTATTVPIGVDPAEWAVTPAKGLFIAFAENAPGPTQAALLPFEAFNEGSTFAPASSIATKRAPTFSIARPRKDL